MMQGHARARPALLDLGHDPLERLQRERLVRFVLQISNASADVVVADKPEKRHHCAVGSCRLASARGQKRRDLLDVERVTADRQKRRCHRFSIPPQK